MQIQLKKHHERYAKYKHTGKPWPSEVPEGWDFQRLRFFIQLNPSKSTVVKLDENFPVSFIPMEAVSEDGVMRTSEIRPINDVKEGYTYFQDNDVLMAKITPCFENGKGAVAKNLNNGIGFGSTEFLVMRGGKKISPKLLWYLVGSHWFRSTGEVEMRGSAGQKRVPERFVKDFFVGLPSKAGQDSIANYLDEKSALIERIIEAKQNQVELLKERRSAIINRAVTLGIDEGGEMKDSGVEWIGKIPKHWTEKPLFACAKEKKVKNIGNKIGKVLSLSYGQIVIRDVESNFGLLPESFETYQIVDAGDVVLRLTDLQNDKKSLRVGLVKEVGIITSAYVCLRANAALLHEYFYELLHSYDIEKVFYSLGAGVRQTMKFEDLKRLSVLVPPKEEQTRITHFIIKETERIDSEIVSIRRSVDLLQEYKASLISNVVTGKIKII